MQTPPPDAHLQYWQLATGAITSLIAIVGALLAVFKYIDEKRKSNETARVESQKPFSAKQQEIYFDLLNTTAFLSNRDPQDPDWEKVWSHFWVLFWGAVPMVADEDVSIKLDAFAEATDDMNDGVRLRNASMDLARACRHSLGTSWEVDLKHVTKTEQTRGELDGPRSRAA